MSCLKKKIYNKPLADLADGSATDLGIFAISMYRLLLFVAREKNRPIVNIWFDHNIIPRCIDTH